MVLFAMERTTVSYHLAFLAKIQTALLKDAFGPVRDIKQHHLLYIKYGYISCRKRMHDLG